MADFYLEVITPEKLFFKGEVNKLIINSTEGEMEVMAGMMPLVVEVMPGELKYEVNKEWVCVYVSEGFMEVRPGGVVLLSLEVERIEDLEERKILNQIARSQEILRQKRSLQEYQLTKSELARAFARLKVRRNHDRD